MRRLTLAGGWLVALLLATTVTWQIVSVADDQVSDRPIAPLNVAAPVIADLQTTTTNATATPSTAVSAHGETSTTATIASSSTTPSAHGATSTTSSPDTTTPQTTSSAPTTAGAAWQTRSVQTVGGTVLLRYRIGEVAYQSAAPAPGYQVEVEKPGPPEVKVEFESQSQKVEIEAAWDDGDLKVSVSGEDDD